MKNIFETDLRFVRLRLGVITSPISEKGEISVDWVDHEPGGRNEVQISYPCYTAYKNDNWGIECGFDVGMIGIFGFLKDNTAIILGTMTSSVVDRSSYVFKNPIASGEFRISSKRGASVYLDESGNITISSPNKKSEILMDPDGNVTISAESISINSTGGSTVNVHKSGINLETNDPISIGGESGHVLYSKAGVGPIVNFSQIGVSTSVTVK